MVKYLLSSAQSFRYNILTPSLSLNILKHTISQTSKTHIAFTHPPTTNNINMSAVLEAAPTTTTAAPPPQQKKKTSPPSVLPLATFLHKQIRVKLSGGRLLTGTLKGYDDLVNIVLDDCSESQEDDGPFVLGGSRKLGLVVCRGTQVCFTCPVEGEEVIENPFLEGGDDEEEDEDKT